MLDPKTSENGCSTIGKLINTLIRQTAHVLGENLDFILKAVLSKMQSSNVLSVQQSLIMVFAHLMHSKMTEVLTFLSNLPGPTGNNMFIRNLKKISRNITYLGSCFISHNKFKSYQMMNFFCNFRPDLIKNLIFSNIIFN